LSRKTSSPSLKVALKRNPKARNFSLKKLHKKRSRGNFCGNVFFVSAGNFFEETKKENETRETKKKLRKVEKKYLKVSFFFS